MNFPFGRQITLVKRIPGPPDPYGDDTYETSEVTVGGAFSPGGSVELGGDVTNLAPTVYLPPGVDVDWTSAVRIDGVTYEVDGSPNAWNHPFTGRAFGIAVHLKAQQRRS